MAQNYKHSSAKKNRTLLKAGTSILFAIIASSHHWLHTLLIALGLTTLGASLLALSPIMRLLLLFVSFIFSLSFLLVAQRKWTKGRPAAFVYLISSLLSLILVISAIPDTLASVKQPPQQNLQQDHDHDEHQ